MYCMNLLLLQHLQLEKTSIQRWIRFLCQELKIKEELLKLRDKYIRMAKDASRFIAK